MALIIRLSCDQCEGESLTVTVGTATDARVAAFRHGWHYVPQLVFGGGENVYPASDLCPVCTGKNPDYYLAEPF